jgi:GST-like protein
LPCQAHHWTDLAPEKPEAAKDYALALVARVWSLLDQRLAELPYLAGAEYSIADIAAFPWITRAGWAARKLENTPNIARWHDRIAARPAVQRGITVPRGAVLA